MGRVLDRNELLTCAAVQHPTRGDCFPRAQVEEFAIRRTRFDPAGTLVRAAELITAGEVDAARAVVASEYPFQPRASMSEAVRATGLPVPMSRTRRSAIAQGSRRRRKLLPTELHRLFTRDNYRCSYSGVRLVTPPALLLLSVLMPAEFPCTSYPNCPLAATHIGLWFLYPSPDHVDPFCGGGECIEENLVTASAAVNMIKSGIGLGALDWSMPRRRGNPDGWDGLSGWFLSRMEAQPELAHHREYGSHFQLWAAAIASIQEL